MALAGWWHDVTDADILSEIAHQARDINHVFVWEKAILNAGKSR